MAERDRIRKRRIKPAGPSESAMIPGYPDDPRSYPHFEWGAPGLPAAPWYDGRGLDEEHERELRREGDEADTSAMKSMIGRWQD